MDKRTEIIKNLIEKGWPSQKAFAESANIPYTTLRSILERGVGKSAVENVIKICKTLNLKVEDLERMAQDGTEDISEPLDLSEEEILTMAAHSTGHEGKLTEEQLAKIRLAVKIALAKENN